MNKDHEKIAQAIVQGLTPFLVQQKDKTEQLEKTIESLKVDDPVTKALRSVFKMADDKGVVEDIKTLETNEDGSFKTRPVEVQNLKGLEVAQELVAKEISSLSVELKAINETHIADSTEKTKAIEDVFLSFAQQVKASIEGVLSSTLKVEVQNPTKFPKEIDTKSTITNLSEIQFPKQFKITNTEPRDAIPVRLVDKAGKKFYEAMYEIITRNGGDINLSGLTDLAQAYDRVNRKIVIGNAKSKFRDSFIEGSSQPDTTIYDVEDNTGGAFIVNQGGNAFASAYLRISMSPLVAGIDYNLITKQTFQIPFKYGFGISASQRTVGQEFAAEFIGVNASDVVEEMAPRADISITGATISVTSNVGTVTATNHGLKGGDRVVITNCPDSAMNVGPVQATIIDKNNFTVPITIANATYNSTGGLIKWADPLDYGRNALGLLYDQTSVTTGLFALRRNGSSARQTAVTIATTTATQSTTSPYSDAFNSSATNEIYATMDEMHLRSFAADSLGGINGTIRYSQGLPDEENYYKLRIRAKNLANWNVPVAEISSIAKTGTTTATVTTATAHGLTSADRVQIWGVRDQTNFPNLTARTAITVLNATQFTIVIGPAVTITDTNGGVVVRIQGNDVSMGSYGYYAQSIQSISRTNNVLSVVGSGTWATPLPGEYVHIYGVNASANAYEGAYKVLRVNTTTLELESVGVDFGSITTGGQVMKRTDVRVHFVKMLDHTRHLVEVIGGRGSTGDNNNSAPVMVNNTVAVSQSTGATISATTGLGGWYIHPAIVGLPDIASAAITTTTTTSSIANNLGNAFQVVIPVTAVSGTTPTMDVRIEESLDGGTNWVTLYDFQRITANGHYYSPVLKAIGRNIRYVQTLGGTTPSFTRSVTRNILPFQSAEPQKRLIDRSVVLTTLNSTTPTIFQGAANNVQLIASVGAITTTAPQLQLEGSEDGIVWYAVGTPLTAVASSVVQQTVSNLSSTFIRARVSTAGVGVTPDYIAIKVWS
jgi:hypothetical protein